jgi:hypothetical protein
VECRICRSWVDQKLKSTYATFHLTSLPPYGLHNAQEAPSVYTQLSLSNTTLQTITPKNSHNSDPLNILVRDSLCVLLSTHSLLLLHLQCDASTCPATVRRHRATTSFATQRLRPSPSTYCILTTTQYPAPPTQIASLLFSQRHSSSCSE